MNNVTKGNIEDLLREAGGAGDAAQVEVCERALTGDDDAWEECEQVIMAARAMEEEKKDNEK